MAEDDLGDIAYSRENATVQEVGVYTDVLTALFAPNENYAVTVEPGTFTITAAPIVPPPPVTPPTPGTPDTPPAPVVPLVTPLPAAIPPVLAPVVEGLVAVAEAVIPDNPTPLAQNEPRETEIADNETPLANHAWCWVHYYIILGIVVTAVYAAGVALRRGLFSRKLKAYEDDLTGGSDPAPGAASRTQDGGSTITIPQTSHAKAAVNTNN